MGLIDNAITQEKDVLEPGKMLEAGSTGYEPVIRTVNDATDTVSGQLDKILAKDSPLNQRAEAGATQYSNSRGLINSSMAAQAGQAAVIDAALPIAQQDANTYSTAAGANQNASNVSLGQSADASSKAALTNAGNANTVALQSLKGEQATTLAQIEANFKTLMQTSDAAGKFFQTTQSALAAILGDPNTSAEQKQAAVDQNTQMLQSYLTVAGAIGNLDLVSLLDFTV